MIELLISAFLLIVGTVYFVRLKLFSPARIFRLTRIAFRRCDEKASGISPIAGLFTALAGSIGTGNIAGVAGAIVIGGPGAIFWMWMSALISLGTKYAEVFCAVRFKTKGSGSPMLYIENGMGKSYAPLAYIFAAICMFAAFGTGNTVQVNVIADSFVAFSESLIDVSDKGVTVLRAAIGIVVAVLAGFVLVGGAKRVASATSLLVPLMSVLYVGGALFVIFNNADAFFSALSSIFVNAFGTRQAIGGVAGFSITQAARYGISRGLFSHEAGMGSSPIAHAATDAKDPVKQGYFGMMEIIIDTFLICTMTALLILMSGIYLPYGDATVPGVDIVKSAFCTQFSEGLASSVLFVCTFLFAFASVISWSFYGKVCAHYLFGKKAADVYTVIFCIVAAAGAVLPLGFVWDAATLLNLLLAVPNLIALVKLAPIVVNETNNRCINRQSNAKTARGYLNRNKAR